MLFLAYRVIGLLHCCSLFHYSADGIILLYKVLARQKMNVIKENYASSFLPGHFKLHDFLLSHCKTLFYISYVTATAVLVTASTDVDKTGASYYGEQTLHYIAVNGESAAVQLRKWNKHIFLMNLLLCTI